MIDHHHVHAVIHRIHSTLGYRDPPFSVSRIMDAMFPEIEVTGRKMDEYATLELYPEPLANGVRATLAYNEKDHHSTQRFSIAHELAHWCFCADFGKDIAGASALACGARGNEKPGNEKRADYFASELLVPLHILDNAVTVEIYPNRHDHDALRDRDNQIQRLASRFNVSLGCMKRRVFDLAYWRRMNRGR